MKNFLLLIVVLIIIVSSAFIWKDKFYDAVPAKSEVDKLKTPSDITFVEDKCTSEDRISFKYYKTDTSQDANAQKNIGYVNNKFGLYVYSTGNFIKKADELVNSNGGDWGYVLIPYNVKDRDNSKWSEIFDLLARKHLIPVIQLWDVDLDKYESQTEGAAKFLNKFPWPIDKKYISAYNEVNDANFWKGRVDPKGYAKILDFTIKTFKSYDSHFFIMNGAFNSTAPNAKGYMDEVLFMQQMNDAVPGIFAKLDGWASHSYPQPDYIGKPTDTGRISIRAYDWELSVLAGAFNVKDLPVFITETGWAHAEGEKYNYAFYDAQTAAEYIKTAFTNVWLPDDRVVAVMPFTIYYDPPFDHFSWVKKDGSVYPQFDVIKALPKIAGKPSVLASIEKEVIKCR